MSTQPKKTRFIRGSALLREDMVTPLHHHDETDDALVVAFDGQQRAMTPCEADAMVAEKFSAPELTEVEHVDGGPRNVKRRHVLGGAAAGFGALLAGSMLPRYSFASPAAAEEAPGSGHLLVCVFLRGGFDGLSAVVPVDDSNYYSARPGIAVKAEQTIGLDGRWALNKNMSAFEPMWSAGELAIVQGSGTPDVSRSHFQDQASVERAAPANVRSGWLGRHLQTSSKETGTFRGITVGNSTVFSLTTTALNTLAISSIDEFDLRTYAGDSVRQSVKTMLDEMYGEAGGAVQAQAESTFAAITTLQSVRGKNVNPENGAVYPKTAWGKGLAEIARLAKAQVGVEVACIDFGGWDMHQNLGSAGNEKDWFSRQAREFSDGLAALRTDLGSRWASTTVVTMSEFGRRVAQNGDNGLDHGQGNTMFVMGGGVHGKKVYGDVPDLVASNLDLGDVPISLDYRQPLSEIVGARLGNAASIGEVFPGFTPGAPIGVV